MIYKFLIFVSLLSLSTGNFANEEEIIMTEFKFGQLAELKNEKKFIESTNLFYPGAPNEEIRIKAEIIIIDLISRLEAGPKHKITKSFVLSQFKQPLHELETFDSEEKDRALMYLENIMDIYGIQSSHGLLNDWRYGFRPSLE